jgi:methionyl-tRNA formyltransferase
MNFGKIDRYLLIGGGQLLYDAALFLKKAKHDVIVVTSARHQLESIDLKTTPIQLSDGLTAAGIEYLISDEINSDPVVSDKLTDTTLGVSIGSAWIFKPSFINRFNGRLLNVHLHQLPERRGAMASYSWDIMDGTKEAGVAIHLVDAGINTGDIVCVEKFRFSDQLRSPVEHQWFVDGKALVTIEEFVADIAAGQDFPLSAQDDGRTSVWPQLNTTAQGFIDWTWSTVEIERFIRAFDDPYKGASTFLNGSRVHLKNCDVDSKHGPFHPFKAGIIFRITENSIYVAANQSALIVNHISDEHGDSIMSQVRTGDRLHTPRETLDQAREFRAVYTSEGLTARSGCRQ